MFQTMIGLYAASETPPRPGLPPYCATGAPFTNTYATLYTPSNRMETRSPAHSNGSTKCFRYLIGRPQRSDQLSCRGMCRAVSHITTTLR